MKGALFARYSRSAKSLRRLFLDEFLGQVRGCRDSQMRRPDVGTDRAERLYARVLNEYGDDSVAQLGGAHVACEEVSNVLTKVLEWGRLMAYLEQSTRYVPYTDRPGGRWKYHVPAELARCPSCGLHAHDGSRLRDLCPLDSSDGGTLPGKVPEVPGRFGRRLSSGHSGQSARYASRPAPGRDDVERGAVWDGPGVRDAAASDVRASAGGGEGVRTADARRAA